MTKLAVIPGEDPGSMQPKPQAEWIPAFAGMTESVEVARSHQGRLQ
ncbi:MAG: hypothetical protein P0Y66_07780 [Candidatus Kaistia colombiensis]|nr:MAG: hypothetical protein P0Y66_07780 [Kaistia sp.]